MSKLSALKKNRGANLKKLQEKLEEQKGASFQRDERIWKPKFNADKGKGTAIVRFLTPKEGDPFVELIHYQFAGPGGHYFDYALQTIGEKDPIQIAAISAFRKAKNDGDEQLRNYARKFLPKHQYFANIQVIKDEENPENEGKVFIYQFGKQIFNLIEKAIQPEYDEDVAFDPFDYWDGANLLIRMKGREIPDSRTGKKVTVPNYEDSKFDECTAFLDGDEDAIDAIYQQTHDLSEFIAPEKFKSFDDVAARFKEVTGRPYNWLSADGLEEHVSDKETHNEMDDNVDYGDNDVDDSGVSDHVENVDDVSDDDAGEQQEETALERFRRLAKKSK